MFLCIGLGNVHRSDERDFTMRGAVGVERGNFGFPEG